MKEKLLIIDAHYLCHRAFHSTRGLEWQGRSTGAVYGFLRSLLQLQNEVPGHRLVFCFEGEGSKRQEIYPLYKLHRRKWSCVEEEVEYKKLRGQITQLRDTVLPGVGFRNIFCFPGFESDDVMARFASGSDEVVLVTGDSDMYQCLRSNVVIYNPISRLYHSAQWFRNRYGIAPRQWAVVKAMAGCSGDNIKGIFGVGEKTAIKYLRDELPSANHAYAKIASNKAIVRRNRPLVKLPFAGCPAPELVDDEVSKQAWFKLTSGLGMRSIAGRPPI